MASRRPVLLTVQPENCRHPFWVRYGTSDLAVYHQIFEEGSYDFRVADAPRVILDAGANIGLAAIYFANRHPNAKIIAMEPEQGNYDLLKLNTAGYKNVIAVQAALWYRDEQIDVVDLGLGEWGFVTREANSSYAGIIRHHLRGMTVDALMRENEIDEIDILKIDIEGSELEVFCDSSAWIDRVHTIVVELHEHLRPGCEAAFEAGTQGFARQWVHGENTIRTRHAMEGPLQ